MKLNLLPATVNKGAALRTSIIVSVVLVLAGVGGAAVLIGTSRTALADVKAQVEQAQPGAARALATSQMADTVVARATPYIRNQKLAKQILASNSKYPNLYDQVRGWVPSFFRITNMAATAVDGTTTQVTLQGTVDTYQQYADLPLAFLRHKEVQSVGRANYLLNEDIVPSLTITDQLGRPRKAGDAPIPDDPLERLAYFEARGSTETYTGTGNFGTATNDTRYAMPNSSYVTITLLINKDMLVPDVRSTLSSSGGGVATTSTAGFAGVPSGAGIPAGVPPPSGGGGSDAGAEDEK